MQANICHPLLLKHLQQPIRNFSEAQQAVRESTISSSTEKLIYRRYLLSL